MKKSKLIAVINLVLSALLWLLGILTLLFNILGLWTPWHLAGFAFMFYLPVPAVSQGLSLIFSDPAEKKLKTVNLICFAVSAGFVLLTVLISTSWFW